MTVLTIIVSAIMSIFISSGKLEWAAFDLILFEQNSNKGETKTSNGLRSVWSVIGLSMTHSH